MFWLPSKHGRRNERAGSWRVITIVSRVGPCCLHPSSCTLTRTRFSFGVLPDVLFAFSLTPPTFDQLVIRDFCYARFLLYGLRFELRFKRYWVSSFRERIMALVISRSPKRASIRLVLLTLVLREEKAICSGKVPFCLLSHFHKCKHIEALTHAPGLLFWAQRVIIELTAHGWENSAFLRSLLSFKFRRCRDFGDTMHSTSATFFDKARLLWVPSHERARLATTM